MRRQGARRLGRSAGRQLGEGVTKQKPGKLQPTLGWEVSLSEAYSPAACNLKAQQCFFAHQRIAF